MTPAEILKPICSSDPERVKLSTPFGMDFKGHRWLAATDGHIAVALLGEADLRADGPDLAVILDSSPSPAFKANVAALKAWAGPPPTEKKACEKCGGGGTGECPTCGGDEYVCKACDGTGYPYDPPRYGGIFGGVLNRVLLARVLATLPENAVDVRIGQREPLAVYVFRAKGWVAAIMPVNGVEKAAENFTELYPAAAP